MLDDKSKPFQTDRLILRDFIEEDYQAIHEYASDPEVVKYMPFGPNTEQETMIFINTVLAHQKEKPCFSYDFALICKPDNSLIGSCRIKITNVEHKEGEIGYILNRSYWNRGYMTEAAQRVVSFGFKELRLHRIYATCDPDNTGSYRVMEKIGMKREGYLREYKLFKGVWRDFLLHSILENEWQNWKSIIV
jgi:[ribosomal protein S5]-alanine N-acetyltransferase